MSLFTDKSAKAKKPSNEEGKPDPPVVDRTLIVDKLIDLGIFVLGVVIALWIDDRRGTNEVKKLHTHYLEILQHDLDMDKEGYEYALEYDSVRAEGCDYLLGWLLKRQSSDLHSFGMVKHDTKGRIGPGFDFEEGWQFFAGDTLQILDEENGWLLDTTGYWVNQRIVSNLDKEFNWFSSEVSDTVVDRIAYFEPYIDKTQTVFQNRTGYDGMITQNTANFLETTEIESKLSDYYSRGAYISWIENYYRDEHFWQYSNLRHSFGQTEMRRFLYLLSNEQNNELIRHLSIASMHSKKEVDYYREMLQKNLELQALMEFPVEE